MGVTHKKTVLKLMVLVNVVRCVEGHFPNPEKCPLLCRMT
jgi:hypothetical protein